MSLRRSISHRLPRFILPKNRCHCRCKWTGPREHPTARLGSILRSKKVSPQTTSPTVEEPNEDKPTKPYKPLHHDISSRVYIKNLPLNSTPESVQQFLDSIGAECVEVNMRSLPDIYPTQYYQWALVQFSSLARAEEFVQYNTLSPLIFNGNQLYLHRPRKERLFAGDALSTKSNILFVGGLPFGVDPIDIWALFDVKQTVKYVVGGRGSPVSHGFAHVHFNDYETPEAIINQHVNHERLFLGTRQLRLDYEPNSKHFILVFERFTGNRMVLSRWIWDWSRNRPSDEKPPRLQKDKDVEDIQCVLDPETNTHSGSLKFSTVSTAVSALKGINQELATSTYRGMFKFKDTWDDEDWKSRRTMVLDRRRYLEAMEGRRLRSAEKEKRREELREIERLENEKMEGTNRGYEKKKHEIRGVRDAWEDGW